MTNAIRNLVAKERNRRRNIPTVLHRPGVRPRLRDRRRPARPVRSDDDAKVDRGLPGAGAEAAGGSRLPCWTCVWKAARRSRWSAACAGVSGKWAIKKVVAGIKALAREFFRGDPELLRRVEKAMTGESETVGKRTGGDGGEDGGGGVRGRIRDRAGHPFLDITAVPVVSGCTGAKPAMRSR